MKRGEAVIASAAKQSRAAERTPGRDCFVASLLQRDGAQFLVPEAKHCGPVIRQQATPAWRSGTSLLRRRAAGDRNCLVQYYRTCLIDKADFVIDFVDLIQQWVWAGSGGNDTVAMFKRLTKTAGNSDGTARTLAVPSSAEPLTAADSCGKRGIAG
jgi:hypothetical protein